MNGDGCLGLTQAVNALRDRKARKPTEADRPLRHEAMNGDGCLGLTQAVNALRDRVARKPTEADAPPCSTFPMTAAAHEALRLSKDEHAAVTGSSTTAA